MKKNILVASLASAVTVAVMAASGLASLGFIDIHRGGTARFDGTNVTCVLPKASGPGVGVACNVSYVRWRNIGHPVTSKYWVTLMRSGIGVQKSARNGTILWSRALR